MGKLKQQMMDKKVEKIKKLLSNPKNGVFFKISEGVKYYYETDTSLISDSFPTEVTLDPTYYEVTKLKGLDAIRFEMSGPGGFQDTNCYLVLEDYINEKRQIN